MEDLSQDKKAELAASLVLLAPPKEVQEVITDVRFLVGENKSFEKKLNCALLNYAKAQNIQVSLPGANHNSLITDHSALNNGRFLCPRSHTSFILDPLSFSVDDVRTLHPDDGDGGSIELEPWRVAVEDSLTIYMSQNYPTGAVSVFAPANQTLSIVIYIETDFKKTFSSGRWKSCWVIEFPETYRNSTLSACGEIKVQTHIFEEGNVQLLSSKKFQFEALAKSPEFFAQCVSSKISTFDSEYQSALGFSLDSMSSSTFKALRRQLPMTHSKVDWNKIAAYQVGSEMSRPT